jgi:hypothetical protein
MCPVFADEYDILCVTESHLDVNMNNDDLSLDFFPKTFIRKDRNNSGGGLLKRTITLHSLNIMKSFDNRFTSQVDFKQKEGLTT